MNPIQGDAPASYGSAPAGSAPMGMPPQRPQFFELLDHLRTSYESILNDNKSYRGMRDEYERKVQEQLTELSAMENAVIDLDRKYRQMKEQYENEIRRLKGQPGLPQSASSPPGPASAAKRTPDSGALPAYPQPTMQPVFAQTAPGPARAHAASTALAAAKFGPPRLGGPPPDTAGPPARLMGIPSLPAASVAGSVGMHRAPIPAHAPVGPGGPRAPGAKMLPMGGMIPPAGPPPQQADVKMHPLKKEPGPVGAPVIIGAQSAAPGFGPPGVHPTVAPQGFSQTLGPATQTEEDYVVYQGRSGMSSDGGTKKVGLQNSYDHDSVVCCVRYSSDGMFLATGSNRNAQIFEAATGQRVAGFGKENTAGHGGDGSGQDSYVRAVCFSPDNNWLITGAEDHVVKVWDCRKRTVKHKLVGHDTDIYSVDASANGRFIISGSGDKRAKLWDLESGKLLTTLGEEFGPTDGITSVSVSPTSQHVAAGSLDKVVRVWDVESSRMVRQFEGHSDSVYSVAFSPDGRMLLSGSLDKSLKLWDLAAAQPSNQCRLSFTGHKDFVLSVMFSPNGRWLISGSKDRTVQFWDPRQSSMALQLQGHKNSVISIAHSPTAREIATGSGDCSSRTWSYT